jgi:cysteine desulfurase/selenocysteine lyase
MFDPQKYIADFPILQRKVHGDKRLVYLDNAATSQKPLQVIEAISNYYQNHNANVHRGIHQVGDESTKLFHHARQTVAEFFGASSEELVVVRNTTEAMNQVAYSWGEEHVGEGDIILTTEMEHHSNIVPWQELVKRKKAHVEFVSVTSEGTLDISDFQKKVVNKKVKLFVFTHVSNTLGTVNPLSQLVEFVKKENPSVSIMVDGAQAAPHLPLNFKTMDVEFYAISAHKMLGPMGIGGLLVKKDVLEKLSPFLFGGGMINEVSTTETSFADDLEERFTAGTPDVASLVGWASACQYLSHIGMQNLVEHDKQLVQYTLQKLRELPQIEIIGPSTDRVGSVAFIYKDVHAHDVGQILDSEGVAVRSGHHCTMPLHVKFGWQASVRVSFQLYNTTEDIDVFIRALAKVKEVFGK